MSLTPTLALGTAPTPLLPAFQADHGGGAGFADLLVERQAARAADGARPGQRHAFDAAPAPRPEVRAPAPQAARPAAPAREPVPRAPREAQAGGARRDAAEAPRPPVARSERHGEARRERAAAPAEAERAAQAEPAADEPAGEDPLAAIRTQAVIDWFARLESTPAPAVAARAAAGTGWPGDATTAADLADGAALAVNAGARRLPTAAKLGDHDAETPGRAAMAAAAADPAGPAPWPLADGAAAIDPGQPQPLPLSAALPAGAAPAALAAGAPTPAGGAAAGAAAPLLLSTPVDSPDFSQALASQLTTFARDGLHEATLQLNPAEMGPIAVKIVLDGAQAQIDFAAAHARTREAIESSLPSLAASLHGAGLTLSGGGVYERHPGREGEPAPGDGSQGGAPRTAADEAPAAAAPRRTAVRGLLDTYA